MHSNTINTYHSGMCLMWIVKDLIKLIYQTWAVNGTVAQAVSGNIRSCFHDVDLLCSQPIKSQSRNENFLTSFGVLSCLRHFLTHIPLLLIINPCEFRFPFLPLPLKMVIHSWSLLYYVTPYIVGSLCLLCHLYHLLFPCVFTI